jgi:hypothetical protein
MIGGKGAGPKKVGGTIEVTTGISRDIIDM